VVAEHFHAAGDVMVVTVRESGVGKDSAVAVDQVYPHVWTFRDGIAVRVQMFYDRKEALEAVGLRE
jgi:ketosteroid isomerase-like protein